MRKSKSVLIASTSPSRALAVFLQRCALQCGQRFNKRTKKRNIDFVHKLKCALIHCDPRRNRVACIASGDAMKGMGTPLSSLAAVESAA